MRSSWRLFSEALFAFAAAVILLVPAAIRGASSVREVHGDDADATPPTLGLEQGTLVLDTPDFRLALVRASQTVAALEPKGTKGFDFTPADQLHARAGDGFFQLGDLTIRLRATGSNGWRSCSTAAARRPATSLPVAGPVLAAADLAPTLPPDLPLKVVRTWAVARGRLALRFALTNTTNAPVEIGALGIPLVFNNVLTNRTLEQAHVVCSFADPYVGLDAGYVQVTRLSGHGPALVVVGESGTPLEAYNPLLSDPTKRAQTFEGFYEWLAHSRAYAENEWRAAEPWNRPSSATLAPGETREYGVRFLLANEIRAIEDTLAADGRPVAIGIPGYVLPTDLKARLFIQHVQRVSAVQVEPEGSLEVVAAPAVARGWANYTVCGKTWGRARLTVTYADGMRQAIHYRVIKPQAEAVADLGRFLTTRQWFVDPHDPFGRGPSVMSYDRELDRIVAQDSRVWIAGLGDEGGSGSWLAAAAKQLIQPVRGEVEKLQQFVDKVLWGRLQHAAGPLAYGVRKSLFYYESRVLPPGFYDGALNWGSWTSWSRAKSEVVDRSYNYPHAVVLYWSFYRLARNQPGTVTNHAWDWYLGHAYETSLAMVRLAPDHAGFGQMEGSVFVELLRDLVREGWTEQAARFEGAMRARAERWRQEAYPFGSEMAWDSTGQEEVYAWARYFGHHEQAQVTLDAVLGYMPTVPHWGYNGNARRYWDFLYGGKIKRIERQLHHYGSALNALPVLAAYRGRPDDLHLLRVGYGGAMGPLTNIDREGFASAAFHAWPDTLTFDPYSGDYGPGFFGHALGIATYVAKHQQLGWLAFGGDLEVIGDKVVVRPRDSARSRVYLAPLGLWLTLDAGRFERVELRPQTRTVRVAFAPANEHAPVARLRIEQPAKIKGIGTFAPRRVLRFVRGAYEVPLTASSTSLDLRPTRPR